MVLLPAIVPGALSAGEPVRRHLAVATPTATLGEVVVPVMPGAEAFSAEGAGALGRVGALVLHGFTGTPHSVRSWGESLAAAGLTVRVPLLPGHGTSWQDMARTGWREWYAAAEGELDELAGRCKAVAVLGLSMGGTLALRLAEQRAGTVAAVVTVNPTLVTEDRRLVVLPLLRRLVPSVRGIGGDVARQGVPETGYDRVPLDSLASLLKMQAATLRDLGMVRAPVLAFRSRVDHVVSPRSGRLLLERTSPGLVEERILESSFHVATVDHDGPRIRAESLEFLRRRLVDGPAAARDEEVGV